MGPCHKFVMTVLSQWLAHGLGLLERTFSVHTHAPSSPFSFGLYDCRHFSSSSFPKTPQPATHVYVYKCTTVLLNINLIIKMVPIGGWNLNKSCYSITLMIEWSKSALSRLLRTCMHSKSPLICVHSPRVNPYSAPPPGQPESHHYMPKSKLYGETW